MGFGSFILASQEPCCGAVCWIQLWVSPTGCCSPDYTERRPSLHTGACHCRGFSKNHWDYIPSAAVKGSSLPRNQTCSKCCNTNLPLKNYSPSSRTPALYLHNPCRKWPPGTDITMHITMLNWFVSLLNWDAKYSQRGTRSVCCQVFHVAYGWLVGGLVLVNVFNEEWWKRSIHIVTSIHNVATIPGLKDSTLTCNTTRPNRSQTAVGLFCQRMPWHLSPWKPRNVQQATILWIFWNWIGTTPSRLPNVPALYAPLSLWSPTNQTLQSGLR